MRNSITLLTLLAALPLLNGCSPADRPVERVQTLSAANLTPVQQGQHQVALAARDALFQRLVDKLVAAMGSKGPAAAIEVCRAEAPQIASNVSQEFGLQIGRTSHRLRNPRNAPPHWAKSLVDAQVAEATLVALPEGELGSLLPIRLKAQCLMCHGAMEQIPTDVQNALKRYYRSDQATGFKEGDLRGWFWVTVPQDACLPATTEEPAIESDVDSPDET